MSILQSPQCSAWSQLGNAFDLPDTYEKKAKRTLGKKEMEKVVEIIQVRGERARSPRVRSLSSRAHARSLF